MASCSDGSQKETRRHTAAIPAMNTLCCVWRSHRSLSVIPASPITSASNEHLRPEVRWHGPMLTMMLLFVICNVCQVDTSMETAIILVQFVQDADARHMSSFGLWCLSWWLCYDQAWSRQRLSAMPSTTVDFENQTHCLSFLSICLNIRGVLLLLLPG